MPERTSKQPVHAYWLGRIPYRDAWDLQSSCVAAVRAGQCPDCLLLLEHPHVFTVGRRGDGSTLLWTEAQCAARGVEVVWTDRGGDATYHGPGQLVGYPILDLRRLGTDVLLYIRNLERSLISYLRGVGLESEAGAPGMTGVWSQGAKVAAIGIKLTGSVTSHGFALNLTTDLDVFNHGIVPCGLAGKRATSVLELAGTRLEVAGAAHEFMLHFGQTFDVPIVPGHPAELRRLVEDRPAGGDCRTVETSPAPK